MSGVVRLRTRVEIDEEAATWIWRMDAAEVSPQDRQAYEAWLRQDPRHARAVKELSSVWRALDDLSEAKRDEKIATFVKSNQRPPGRRRWWMAAAAAAIVGIVVVSVVRLEKGSDAQVLATAVGQQRQVTLADGSQVSLNTNTIVETDLKRATRDIYLRKGEAHFQVAHDKSRPFLVHAGDALVRAVGTAFEVRVRSDHHVDVVVEEGRVEVRPAQGATPDRVQALNAGQRLSTSSSTYAVVPVSEKQLSSGLAWRQGAIVFDDERLGDAVAEIERYTDARIIVADPATAALRVGGRFRTGEVQEFFDALQAALPVVVRRTEDGVYIEPRRE